MALISALMLCIGAVVGYRRALLPASTIEAINMMTAESRTLARDFGPQKHSQYEEEWALRDFFKGQRDGVFVDVGANDYEHMSNTFYLETEMGWSGVAVDPLKEFEAGYKEHRPRTRFRSFFVSDRSNEQAKMYLLKGNTLVTSADKTFTERYGKDTKEVTAPTITLNDLLDSEHIQRIDFLSIDVELHEPEVLAGFDVQRFRPALICIEAHPEVRQQILDYFATRKYVVVGRYLRADPENLYFKPVS